MKWLLLLAVASVALAGCQTTGTTAKPRSLVKASWYHEGTHTATGERYRPDGLTAAHRTARLGSHMCVTHAHNGRSVRVRINDRGPAKWTGKDIDLSRGAARELNMISQGVALVQLEDC